MEVHAYFINYFQKVAGELWVVIESFINCFLLIAEEWLEVIANFIDYFQMFVAV